MSGHDLTLRTLGREDACAAARLVAGQPDDYVRFFHALGANEAELADTFAAAERDVYAGLFWRGSLICIHMLRGWDAGYRVPSFGLIVDADFRGQRVLTVALEAAKLNARLAGADRLMVKVHPENEAATKGALRLGFQPSGAEPGTGNIVYHLEL